MGLEILYLHIVVIYGYFTNLQNLEVFCMNRSMNMEELLFNDFNIALHC